MKTLARHLLILVLAGLLPALPARAWDYDGHRLINQLALDSLPTNFPAFVRAPAARERIGFLAGEADRWRNSPDASFKHCNGPDHFFDLDLLPSTHFDPARLTPFRYEFTVQLAAAHAARPQDFPPIDPNKDSDKTKALIGFLPWAITEYQGKLKSAFSYLREYESAGTPEEISNARENVIYVMGVMGHFVGDGSQPLHTTRHHHGWVGENPRGYSTNYSIHSWIDGGYIQQFGLDTARLRAGLRPAKLLPAPAGFGAQTEVFPVVVNYLMDQFKLVEPLYQLDKAGKLSGRRERNEEGHAFIAGQMVKAAQMLGDLWLTAYHQAPPDMFLRSALARRKLAQEKPAP